REKNAAIPPSSLGRSRVFCPALLHRLCIRPKRPRPCAALAAQEPAMPRHAAFLPAGVIPAVLLPFDADLAIDEKSFRAHLRQVAAAEGLSAITINAHSTEVASCTFEEQRRVMEIAADEVGDRLPVVHAPC